VHLQHHYIAIEGNIGAGKSTLSNMLSKDFSTKLILEEFEDNSFLPKFYKDPLRYAFPLEMSFLSDRFNQLKELPPSMDLFNRFSISDYMFAKCLLFAKVNLNEDEFQLFQRLFEIIQAQIIKPDLIVYLQNPVEKLQWNITNRGRSYEQKIPDEYLQKLHLSYMEYLQTQSTHIPVLMIDCSQLDFVKNIDDYENLKAMIVKKYEVGMHTVKWLK
jgi:deoxyguanosine kinase